LPNDNARAGAPAITLEAIQNDKGLLTRAVSVRNSVSGCAEPAAPAILSSKPHEI
jgi:hypothetical protein